MDERTLGIILAGIVYPAMIVGAFGLFVFLLQRAEKNKRSSRAAISHRIRG